MNMKYYLKMLVILWKLPIKLRYKDIETLADHVQQMRVSNEELEEYVQHLRTYINIDDENVVETKE